MNRVGKIEDAEGTHKRVGKRRIRRKYIRRIIEEEEITTFYSSNTVAKK